MKIHATHTTSSKSIGKWFYCRHCGLIYLNNNQTKRRARTRCPDKD